MRSMLRAVVRTMMLETDDDGRFLRPTIEAEKKLRSIGGCFFGVVVAVVVRTGRWKMMSG
jgi:hypothetical protein